MKETTLQRIKRLNAEGKHTIIDASDEWWHYAASCITQTCVEVFGCETEELTDFQIGAGVGAAQVAHEFASNNKREKNDK